MALEDKRLQTILGTDKKMKFSFQKYKFLLLLLITDIAFIILHILFLSTNLLDSPRFLITLDQGFAEFFQYTKELWIGILFLVLGIKSRKGLFYAFSLLFVYFLMDDSLSIHENLGKLLADLFRFESVLGLRANDLGELLVMAVFGILFFALFFIFYLISDQKFREIIRIVLVLTILLMGFGVIVDMVEIMVKSRTTSLILAVVDDGGEMIVMSIFTWFAFQLDLKSSEHPITWSFLKKWPLN